MVPNYDSSEYLIDKKDLFNLLDEYSVLFYDKEVTYKVPYSLWKALKRVEEDFIVVLYDFNNEKVSFFENTIYLGEIPFFNDFEHYIWELVHQDCTVTMEEENIVKRVKERKENKKMKGFNFDFGPCTSDNIKMSVYGLAVKNMNGEWVSYNPSTKQIINVDLLNFDGRKFMFKMPVAIKDIAIGDIIVHNRVPMFVTQVDDNGIVAVDVMAGEEKKILPTNSPFGFNFVTKVVSMFSAFEGTPNPDSPFGNFLPFMLMGEDTEDIDPFVMCMMMQQNGDSKDMFNNPMMMYMLMKGNKDMLPIMFMMKGN